MVLIYNIMKKIRVSMKLKEKISNFDYIHRYKHK